MNGVTAALTTRFHPDLDEERQQEAITDILSELSNHNRRLAPWKLGVCEYMVPDHLMVDISADEAWGLTYGKYGLLLNSNSFHPYVNEEREQETITRIFLNCQILSHWSFDDVDGCITVTNDFRLPF